MKSLGVAVAALVILSLSGCSSASPEPGPTVTVTVTAAPEPTTTDVANGGQVDRTTDVQDVAGEAVTEAIEVRAGEFVVTTSLSDDRDAALAICEAIKDQLDATHVRVDDAAGSTVVILRNAFAECVGT